MASGGAPDKLSPRHDLVGALHLCGLKNHEIAAALDYSENRVSILLNSPLMQQQLTELRSKLRTSAWMSALELLESEARANVLTLIDIRDRSDDTNRRLAASDLLDRTPKLSKRTHHEGDATLRVTLSVADVRQMLAANADVIDADVIRPLPAVSPQASAPLRSLDETVAAAEREMGE